MAGSKKATYEPSAQQRDLEERADSGNESALKIGQAQGPQVNPGDPAYKGDGNDTDGYVGTDPIYQNYSNDTEKPLQGDGVEDELHEQYVEALDPQPEKPEAPAGDDESSQEDAGDGTGDGSSSSDTSDAGGTSTPPASN